MNYKIMSAKMDKVKIFNTKSQNKSRSSSINSNMSNSLNSEFDVIVIGGGLTGLMTGYYILKKHANLSVMIIESEDKIGGRINGTTLGFYAHTFQKYISDLIKEFNLSIDNCRKSDDKSRVFWTEEGPIYEEESPIVASQVFYFVKSLDGLSKKLKFHSYSKKDKESQYFANLSVEEYLEQMIISKKARLICRSLIYSTCGISDLKNVSFLWLLVMYNNSGGFYQRLKLFLTNNTKYFITGDFGKLIHKVKDKIIEENGVIRCSETAKSIKTDNFKIFITTTSKTYECSYAVIAVPPPFSSRIIIESKDLHESLLKTIKTQFLYYSEDSTYFEATLWSPFWFSEYSGNIITNLNKNVNLRMAYDASREERRRNSLAGFIHRSRNSFNGPVNIFRAINLSFKTQKAVNYVDYHEKAGQSFMNVLKPCPIEFHLNPLLHPHHSSRVYFAASEYAECCPGTADGAIEAGERAACLVLHHARPQALNAVEMAEFIPKKIPKWSEDTRELDWAHTICLFSNIAIFLTLLIKTYIFRSHK